MSNGKNSMVQPSDSISRRKFLINAGAASALAAGAGIPLETAFAADGDRTATVGSPFWYDSPAEDWKSAIPIGNGRIGGMIFGEVQDEQVLLNESSIWSGPPVPANNSRGPEIITRIRDLLFAGKPVEAEHICETELLARDLDEDRCYQPLGFLRLHHKAGGDVTGYRRTLDYDAAIVTTQFEQDGVAYRREAFVSAPDQVLALWYSANQRGKVSFTIGLDRPDGATVTAKGDSRLRLSGRAFAKGGRHPGTRFDALLQVTADGGKVTALGNQLKISDANSVTLLVTVVADYNFRQPESPLTREDVCAPQGRSRGRLSAPLSPLHAPVSNIIKIRPAD
jgi:alpha-L-fucosidase 2